MGSAKKIFNRYQYDIALEKGAGPQLVTWVCALMVFFVTLSFAANFFLSGMTQTWMTDLVGTVTVEIKPSDPSSKSEESVRKTLNLLKQHPAVEKARLLDKKEILGLIEPWLGREMPDDIPLPRLIDIKLTPEASLTGLHKDISTLVPDAVIDSHAETLGAVKRLVTTLRLFVLLLTAVIVLLAVAAIAGIVRAKFAIHRQEVETLHLIGADDEYIARQFRHHTLKGSLKGALMGLTLMIAAVLGVSWATHAVDASIFPQIQLIPVQWIEIILSPVLIGTLVAHITAQTCVMRELAKLP